MFRLRMILLLGFTFLFLGKTTYAQTEERPGGHAAVKVDLFPLVANEARLSFEIPLKPAHSLVAEAGFIYPNRFLYQFEQISDFYLSTGGALGLAYRYYPNKKQNHRIFPMETYLSPGFFTSYSTYQDEWFDYLGPDRNTPDEFHLISAQFNQVGFRGLIGFQNRRGRVMADFYFGLGFKTVFSEYTTHAITVESGRIIDGSTTFPESSVDLIDYTATVHLGIKLGLRTGKRSNAQ